MTADVQLYLQHEAAATRLAADTELTHGQAYNIVGLLGGRIRATFMEPLIGLVCILGGPADMELKLTMLIREGWLKQ